MRKCIEQKSKYFNNNTSNTLPAGGTIPPLKLGTLQCIYIIYSVFFET